MQLLRGNKVVAIIPARGGSKGIPKKNIKKLNGKPLIAYTIEETLKSKYIDRVIVSTEDLDIAQISKSFGAEVPFLRPIELAQDDTPGIEPIFHSIKHLEEKESYAFEYIICLQCTSPFRSSKHIDDALEKLIESKANSIVSVCESEISPYWMKTVENGVMRDFIKSKNFVARRQDAPKVYALNGAIYAAKKDFLIINNGWYDDNTLAFIMDKKSSIDIDNILDFKFAEFLMKEGYNE